MRREWRAGVDDPVRQREILASLDRHAERQLEPVRARRDEIVALEAELPARRKRIRARLRELEDAPARTDSTAGAAATRRPGRGDPAWEVAPGRHEVGLP